MKVSMNSLLSAKHFSIISIFTTETAGTSTKHDATMMFSFRHQ
jgi:hypothetical protein